MLFTQQIARKVVNSEGFIKNLENKINANEFTITYQQQITHSGGGGNPKVLISGKLRKVVKEGRYSYVTINGEKMTIAKAKKAEKAEKKIP